MLRSFLFKMGIKMDFTVKFFSFLLIFLAKISFAHQDCVILLHGLARTSYSMEKLQIILQNNHYTVVNHTYPSTRNSIQQLADTVISPLVQQCLHSHPTRIHFVTHSLGGIILQTYLQRHTIPLLDSIVMLSPPNHGSPLADSLHKNILVHFLLGPALNELTTNKQPISLPKSYTIGIIAGSYDFNPLGKRIFKTSNDGIVSVASTKLDHMTDFIVLPVSHTFMMRNKQVLQQILYFLKSAHFCRKRTCPI